MYGNEYDHFLHIEKKKKKNVSETPDAIHSVNREMIFTDKSTF